jgi:heme a synthase
LRVWFWSGAALTFAVLVIGGITRLTQSGLSIVDWRPIMGVVPPLDEAQWQEAFDRYRQFPEYQLLRRGMELGEFKVIFFWEYLHRMAARLIGLVFLVPFGIFWAAGYLDRRWLGRALTLFALGALQGFMGWYMVMSGLVDQPAVSHYRLAAHLVLAFSIFGLCVSFALDLTKPRQRPALSRAARSSAALSLGVVAVLFAFQVVWGAFVAGLKAGLVFPTFPLMGGAWVPPGILMLQPPLVNLFENPITVQWIHRVLGTLLALAALAAYLRARRGAEDPVSVRFSVALLALVALQYLLGVLTVVHHVPIVLAVGHQAMALVLLAVLVAWAHHVRRAPTRAA